MALSDEGSVERAVADRETVGRFVSEMVALLGWELESGVREDGDGGLRVELSGPDRDIIVQNRAEVLDSIQYLVNRAFGGGGGGGSRIVVDCDGYRGRKEVELKEIAERVCDRVRRTGASEELGLMNPYERRIVHLVVAELEGVRSESAGDGLMKRVVILPE